MRARCHDRNERVAVHNVIARRRPSGGANRDGRILARTAPTASGGGMTCGLLHRRLFTNSRTRNATAAGKQPEETRSAMTLGMPAKYTPALIGHAGREEQAERLSCIQSAPLQPAMLRHTYATIAAPAAHSRDASDARCGRTQGRISARTHCRRPDRIHLIVNRNVAAAKTV